MKKLLFLLLFCLVASAQYTPTGSKTRWINGVGLSSTRDTSLFTSAADTNIVTTWNGNIYWKGTGYWNKIGHSTNVGAQIHDSLYAVYQLKAGTSAGARLVSNSGTVVAEWGLGGSANMDFHGFAGYDANRSASYTVRSFTDKGYVDSSKDISATFVTLEQYGGNGNGTFDNSTAWTTAIATGNNIWLKPGKTYYSSTSVTLNDYQVIQGGSGATMKFSGITAVNVGNYSKVIGVKFKGGKATASSSTEFAIKGHKKLGYIISGNFGDSIATAFIYIDSTVTASATNTFTGAIVSDNAVYNSKVFMQLRERGEYVGVYNNIVNKCDTAISDIGGNNTINGGQYTENVVGYYANTNGINPAHNHIVGATFNHNDYNIYLENIPSSFGQNFVGSSFQVGDVYIKGSSTINFEACTFAFITGDSLVNDASKITVSNSNFRISIPYYEINSGTKKVRANNLLWSATQNEIDLWEGEVNGILPAAKGGLGNGTWTTGSIPFVGAGSPNIFRQNNSKLFWDSSYNALRVGYNGNFYNEQVGIGPYITPKLTYAATGGYYWSTRVDGASNQEWKLRYENDNFDVITADRLHNVTFGGDVSAANLSSGTYSPTISGTSNVTSVTASTAQYMRVGSTVTVSGKITATPSNTTNSFLFYMTIPVSSSFGSESQAAGVASKGNDQTPATACVGAISAEGGGGKVLMTFSPSPTTTSGIFFYQFTYQIL